MTKKFDYQKELSKYKEKAQNILKDKNKKTKQKRRKKWKKIQQKQQKD